MKIVDNKCPTCGANLEYNPKDKNWHCHYCNNNYLINNLDKHHHKESINELICPSCNAKLFVNQNIISTKCIYCSSSVIVRETDDQYPMPSKVIPFAIDKNTAINTFLNLSTKRKLLPNDFNIQNNISEIKGVYIPFWLYSYHFKVNIHYRNTNNAIESNKIKHKKVDFNLIPFDANEHLDNKLTESLEPFNYQSLTDFNTAYLSGFIAQKYDILPETGKEKTLLRATNNINNMFKDIHSKHYIKNASIINEELINEEIHYTLLPIWLLNIEYQNQKYIIAINGQTGKISGNLPIDNRKLNIIKGILFLSLSLIAIIILVLLRKLGII